MDAEIYHGANLDFAYGNAVQEGDTFKIGSLELGILETPGHTPESISITVKDTDVSDQVYMVFTGDALFAGEVGRTDFYQGEERERMSKKLYESIVNKLLPLGDGVVVCPAHGAGSVCGSAIGDFEFTTIGYEKKTNPMLQKSKEEFIRHKVEEMLHLPPYFRQMEIYNKEGSPIIHHLPNPSAINVSELIDLQKQGAQVIDLRKPAGFAAGHIPNSLSIWRDGVSHFGGWVLNYEDPIVLVDSYNLGLDAVIRSLVRLGYDKVEGYLAEGISVWNRSGNKLGQVKMMHVDTLKERLHEEGLFVLDVGKTERWEAGHITGAHYVYVGELPKQLDEIPKDKEIVIYCESGFKTSLAASLLKQHGYEHVTELVGGWFAWQNAGYPIETR